MLWTVLLIMQIRLGSDLPGISFVWFGGGFIGDSVQREELKREVLKKLGKGFRFCRINLEWAKVQPDNPNQWFYEIYDSDIAWIKKNNMEPFILLGWTPKWASRAFTWDSDIKHTHWIAKANYKLYAPDTIYYDKFMKFIRKTIRRYAYEVPDSLRVKYFGFTAEADIAFLLNPFEVKKNTIRMGLSSLDKCKRNKGYTCCSY